MLILLNPGMVWPLLDTTTSDTEKALSRFNFAKTVSLPLALGVFLRMFLLSLGQLAHEMVVSSSPLTQNFLKDTQLVS